MENNDLQFWINNNSWIYQSELYDTQKYIWFTKQKYNILPTIDINNLSADLKTLKQVIKFIKIWGLYKYPIQICIFLIHCCVLDNLIIENENIKIPINIQKNTKINIIYNIIKEYNNIEIFNYVIENNLLTKDHLFIEILENKDIKLLQKLINNDISNCVFKFAIKHNINYDTIKLLLQNYAYKIDDIMLSYAIDNYFNYDIINLLLKNYHGEISEKMIYNSIKGYGINIIKLLMNFKQDKIIIFTSYTIIKAINIKDYDSIKLLLSYRYIDISDDILIYHAVKTNNYNIVKLILDNTNNTNNIIILLSKKLENINNDIIKLLISYIINILNCDEILNITINNNYNHEIVKYVLELNLNKNILILNNTIKNNNYKIIELLLIYEYIPNNNSLEIAIENNNYEIVKLLLNYYKNNINETNILFLTVIKNNTDIVELLFENNIKIHTNLLYIAINNSNYKIVELLINNGALIYSDDYEIYRARIKGERKIVKLLLKNGFKDKYITYIWNKYIK